jgi:hypothetical protein
MRRHYYRSSVLSVLLCSAIGCAALPAAPGAPATPTPPQTSANGANGTTIVAIAPPAGPQCTIWDFLGVKTLCAELGMVANCGLNLLGTQFPGLASALPMTSLTNPAAAASSNPAVAAAASAKADENAAPQKVAALRYLGTLGCGGCYPEVEKALLAGLDDCIEVVRFEAASALAETSRNQCRYCTSNRCCSANIRKKLIEIATKTNDNGCYTEPSARVRRMARVALCNCTCDPLDALPQPMPAEGPTSEEVVPPKPDPQVAVIIHDIRTTPQRNETAKGMASTSGSLAKSPTDLATAADLLANSKESVAKQYDESHKPADIVIKASEKVAKPSSLPLDISSKQSLTAAQRSQMGPRIRWERAAVSIYRFETKDEALLAMDFVRRKAIGETIDAPTDANIRHVTTRVSGWTRAQDIPSPDLARILFELPVGQVSPVVEVGDMLLVCRVLEREDPETPPDNHESKDVYNSNYNDLE